MVALTLINPKKMTLRDDEEYDDDEYEDDEENDMDDTEDDEEPSRKRKKTN